jgi:uncharacterized membrane protein
MIPGIYQLKRRSYQFMGFIILLYFLYSCTKVVMAFMSKHDDSAAFVEFGVLGLSVLIFSLSLMASRILTNNSNPTSTSQD